MRIARFIFVPLLAAIVMTPIFAAEFAQQENKIPRNELQKQKLLPGKPKWLNNFESFLVDDVIEYGLNYDSFEQIKEAIEDCKPWKGTQKDPSKCIIEIPPGFSFVSEKPMHTRGLCTCSGMAFTHKNRNFMVHATGLNRNIESQIISKAIRDNFDIEELKRDDSFSIFLLSGYRAEEPIHTTMGMLEIVLSELGLIDKKVVIGSARDGNTYLGVCQEGVYVENM